MSSVIETVTILWHSQTNSIYVKPELTGMGELTIAREIKNGFCVLEVAFSLHELAVIPLSLHLQNHMAGLLGFFLSP